MKELPGFLQEVVWVLNYNSVGAELFHFLHYPGNFPFRPVGRVFKQNESARLEESVDISKVARRRFVPMISVNETE